MDDNRIYCFVWDVIIHPCIPFEDCSANLAYNLGHGRLISSHWFTWMYILWWSSRPLVLINKSREAYRHKLNNHIGIASPSQCCNFIEENTVKLNYMNVVTNEQNEPLIQQSTQVIHIYSTWYWICNPRKIYHIHRIWHYSPTSNCQ